MNFKHLSISSLSVAILATVTPSFAGYTLPANVSVDETNMNATGAMGTAYGQWLAASGNPDPTPYIACITIYVSGQADVFCYANDGNTSVNDGNGTYGNIASCEYGGTTFDAFGKTAQVLTQDAFIEFSWNSNGYCTQLISEAVSAFPPK